MPRRLTRIAGVLIRVIGLVAAAAVTGRALLMAQSAQPSAQPSAQLGVPATDVSRIEWVPCDRIREYKVTAGTIEAIERAYAERNAPKRR